MAERTSLGQASRIDLAMHVIRRNMALAALQQIPRVYAGDLG